MPVAAAIPRCPDRFHERGIEALNFRVRLGVVGRDSAMLDGDGLKIIRELLRDELRSVIGHDFIGKSVLSKDPV